MARAYIGGVDFSYYCKKDLLLVILVVVQIVMK